MAILWLFVFAMFVMTVALIPRRPRRWVPGATLRQRSREHYDLVMSASNWSPEHFNQREDGRWFNARGEEGVCLTLDEILERENVPIRE